MSVFPEEWEVQRQVCLHIQQMERQCIDETSSLMMDELLTGVTNSSSTAKVYIPTIVHKAGSARWMQYLTEFCHLNNF